MTDIVDALAKISHCFRAVNLQPPAAILLSSHDEGMRLLWQLHQLEYIVVPMDSQRGGKVVEHLDGMAWMEVEVYGIRIGWPAMKLAKPEGGYVWI